MISYEIYILTPTIVLYSLRASFRRILNIFIDLHMPRWFNLIGILWNMIKSHRILGSRIISGLLMLKSDRILQSESDTIQQSGKIDSQYCNLVLIRWVIIMIRPSNPWVISSSRFLSDPISDWLILVFSESKSDNLKR